MIRRLAPAGIWLSALLAVTNAAAEPVFWGVQSEQLEARFGDGQEVFAWDFDALVGTDEMKVVWRSEAEFARREHAFETLENQLRAQLPISDFFDAVAGLRLDTPAGPDRVYGVLGLHGLAPQWFEIDADLYLSDRPVFRFEVEYEALITNRLILTPSVEVDLPLADDEAIGFGAWGPKIEVGLRLSYDLVDRAFSPYVGLHFEQVLGESADLARAEGEDRQALQFVIGARVMF